MSQPMTNAVQAVSFTGATVRPGKPVSGKTLKAVAGNLAFHHNGKDGRCYPGIQTISKETQLDPHTVTDAIRILELMGLFEKDLHRGKSTHYIFRKIEGEQGRERFTIWGETSPVLESDFSVPTSGKFRLVGMGTPTTWNQNPSPGNLLAHQWESALRLRGNTPCNREGLTGKGKGNIITGNPTPSGEDITNSYYSDLSRIELGYEPGEDLYDSHDPEDLIAQAALPVPQAVLADGVPRMHGNTLVVLDTGWDPPISVNIPLPRPARVVLLHPARDACRTTGLSAYPPSLGVSYTWDDFVKYHPYILRLPPGVTAAAFTQHELREMIDRPVKDYLPNVEEIQMDLELLFGKGSSRLQQAMRLVEAGVEEKKARHPWLFLPEGQEIGPADADRIYLDYLSSLESPLDESDEEELEEPEAAASAAVSH